MAPGGEFRFQPRGVPRFVLLTNAADGESVGGYVLGDGRAGRDVRAVADVHRRHELRVGPDEHAFADDGLVLGGTVVVAENRSRADVRVLADVAVAEVREVVR